MSSRPGTTLLVLLAALMLAPGAFARGGHYTVAGGTAAERATVADALNGSSFDFDQVPALVKIQITPTGTGGASWPGIIHLDPTVLDRGERGAVEHEYAHQVDLYLLTDAERAEAQRVLGGQRWFYDGQLPHDQYGAERFASMLAWVFDLRPSNDEGPRYNADTAAVPIGPAEFRAMLTRWGLVPPESSPESSPPSSNALESGAWNFFLLNP